MFFILDWQMNPKTMVFLYPHQKGDKDFLVKKTSPKA